MAKTTQILVAAVIACTVLGCAKAEPTGAEPSSEAPVAVVRFNSGDGLFEGPFAAQLKAFLGSKTEFEISMIAARRGGPSLVLRVPLSESQVRGGGGTIGVTVSGVGTKLIELNSTNTPAAQSGTVDVSLANGKLSGTVKLASPARLSGTFSGKLEVSCWVPASTLSSVGPDGGGTKANDGAEALVEDTHLKTAACQQLRGLAEPSLP
jgi:hypothetical protein